MHYLRRSFMGKILRNLVKFSVEDWSQYYTYEEGQEPVFFNLSDGTEGEVDDGIEMSEDEYFQNEMYKHFIIWTLIQEGLLTDEEADKYTITAGELPEIELVFEYPAPKKKRTQRRKITRKQAKRTSKNRRRLEGSK
jgi:hypothetical protein